MRSIVRLLDARLRKKSLRFGPVPASRQRIANLFPTAHRLVFVASNRQRIASIGGGGKCCSRHLGARSLPFLRCLRPRVSAGDYAGNLSNRRENRRCAARPPASGAIRARRSRPAVQTGTATSRRRKCRLRPTFKWVMRWRMKDPPDLAMRCRFASTQDERPRAPTPYSDSWPLIR